MSKINGIEVGNVVKEALDKARLSGISNWNEIKDIAKLIADSMLNDLKFIAKKKATGGFDAFDAKIFLEDQKMVARTRLRSVAIITLQTAERVLNAITDVFKGAANTALGWDLF
ncbi:hypothetical protein [Pseudoalteromonas gelatinilytica]|uniref:Uncharacterized protein n=1 Tax=Pseudoalteromonas gelatinilytica TaxID=1703256 RepID=A0A3A3F8V8_9GAMM|nr:hypothetical protein [Pseudoalteromonas profundi]RJF37922.1 hypothetical protein D4741_07615 [Pseudoalteromonas profundi]